MGCVFFALPAKFLTFWRASASVGQYTFSKTRYAIKGTSNITGNVQTELLTVGTKVERRATKIHSTQQTTDCK